MPSDHDIDSRTATVQDARALDGLWSSARQGRITVGSILFLLMAAIILPCLIFFVLLIQRNDHAQQRMVTTLAEATAGSIAETVDTHLAGMLTTLRVLSIALATEQDDPAGFYMKAAGALEDTGTYLVAIDEDMAQLLNTRVPFGQNLDVIGDIETIARAIAQDEPAFSNAYFGTNARTWVFNVVLPTGSTPHPGTALILSQDAERLSKLLANQNLRGGWNATLLDRKGVVLASSFMPSAIGEPFFLATQEEKSKTAMRSAVTVEGEAYEVVSAPSARAGWEVVVWAPAKIVRAPLTRILRMLALGGLAIIAIGVVLAWVLGRQIAKPVRRLAQDARRLGAGENVEPTAYRVAEIATVSLALAQASRDRQAAENEIRFLMREVAHRSKNQLTVVSSIAKQTARHARSLTAFHDSFQKRVQGLARSTDLLVAGGVAGVELRALLTAQIEPFAPADGQRLEMEGPRFRLSHQAAQTLGLALHELATNAAKYGAFSMPEGKLAVSWKREGEQLKLVWREYVPGLRRRDRTRGFGTEVIERMLGGALDAAIERILHRDGLEYGFEMPVDKLRPEPAERDGAGGTG